jgi:hypothetical protein
MNFLTQQLLVFDVGQAFWNQPERFAIFGEYRKAETDIRSVTNEGDEVSF